MEKLFFLDYKTIDDLGLPYAENSVLKILKRYSLEKGDYEQNVLTEAIFIRLGWSNKYKDTIFSFRTLICKIFEVYSKNDDRIKFYFRNNTLEYEINNYKADNYRYNKGTLYKKATDKECALNKVMNQIIDDKEIFNELCIVAQLVDSLSNFTTHPGYPFNQAKGKLVDVADSLNLMIDKVQYCIDNDKNLGYGNKPSEIIVKEKLSEWKEWFVKNRTSYCLNDIYEINEEGKIVGKKLFASQSFKKPLPTTKEEIKECLCNIKEILYKRGELMYGSIH